MNELIIATVYYKGVQAYNKLNSSRITSLLYKLKIIIIKTTI